MNRVMYNLSGVSRSFWLFLSNWILTCLADSHGSNNAQQGNNPRYNGYQPHGYQPQRFLSHQHCADCLLPLITRVWEHKTLLYSSGGLTAVLFCWLHRRCSWLKPLQKKKPELLFPFIYMTDFSKPVKSSDEHDLFMSFELCLIGPMKLTSADTE